MINTICQTLCSESSVASVSSSNIIPKCCQRPKFHNEERQQVPALPIKSALLINPQPLTDSFSVIPDYNLTSILNHQKKALMSIGLSYSTPQDLHNTPCPKEASVPFATDPVSNFELDCALLEQALDHDPAINTKSTTQPQSDEKATLPNILDHDFYLTDILGDSTGTIQAQPLELTHELPNNTATLCPTNIFNCVKDEVIWDEATMDSHLSSALATLGGYNYSIPSGKVQEEHIRPVSRSKNNVSQNKPLQRVYSMNANISDVPGTPQSDCSKKRTCHSSGFTKQQDNRSHGTETGDEEEEEEEEEMAYSPVSDSFISAIGSHPDLYENLKENIRVKVDELRARIAAMPRRKLREYLAALVTMEDVEPLMIINRDELAGMLGLGVTTWKMFVHHTLGVPRWPARALKSHNLKMQKVRERIREAERRGDAEGVRNARRDLNRMNEGFRRKKGIFKPDKRL